MVVEIKNVLIEVFRPKLKLFISQLLFQTLKFSFCFPVEIVGLPRASYHTNKLSGVSAIFPLCANYVEAFKVAAIVVHVL